MRSTGTIVILRFLFDVVVSPRRTFGTIGSRSEIKRDLKEFKYRFGTEPRCVLTAAAGQRKSRKRETVLLVAHSELVSQAKIQALLGSALGSAGYEIAVLFTDRGFRSVHGYFHAVGIQETLSLEKYAPTQQPPDAQEAIARLFGPPITLERMKAFHFHDVDAGLHVLGSVIRSRHTATLGFDDRQFVAELKYQMERALLNIYAAEAVFKNLDPTLVLFNERAYSAFGPLFDTAVKQGRDVILAVPWLRDDAIVFKRYVPANRRLHPCSISDSAWEQISKVALSPGQESELDQDFTRRYNSSEWFFSSRLVENKEIVTEERFREMIGIAPGRRVAIVFSPLPWDGTFFWGEDLFPDYETWMIETLRAAIANPNLEWVFKLHPSNMWKLKSEGFEGELAEHRAIRKVADRLPPHVHLLEPDTRVNTVSLFGITDYGITIRGTAGIELSCYGVPALTAGTGRYSGHGFTYDSASQEEYLERLANLHEIPPLPDEKVALARRYAHALLCGRHFQFDTFKFVSNPDRGSTDPLAQNLQINASDLGEVISAPDLQRFLTWARNRSEEDLFDATYRTHDLRSTTTNAPRPA